MSNEHSEVQRHQQSISDLEKTLRLKEQELEAQIAVNRTVAQELDEARRARDKLRKDIEGLSQELSDLTVKSWNDSTSLSGAKYEAQKKDQEAWRRKSEMRALEDRNRLVLSEMARRTMDACESISQAEAARSEAQRKCAKAELELVMAQSATTLANQEVDRLLERLKEAESSRPTTTCHYHTGWLNEHGRLEVPHRGDGPLSVEGQNYKLPFKFSRTQDKETRLCIERYSSNTRIGIRHYRDGEATEKVSPG